MNCQRKGPGEPPAQLEEGPGVADGGFDLGPVADDPDRPELDPRLATTGHLLRIEAVEGLAVPLAPLEDRDQRAGRPSPD
jgi:hypothetical protein